MAVGVASLVMRAGAVDAVAVAVGLGFAGRAIEVVEVDSVCMADVEVVDVDAG